MTNAEYIVCPRCGNPMHLIDGRWVCRVCGYIQERRSTPRKTIATKP